MNGAGSVSIPVTVVQGDTGAEPVNVIYQSTEDDADDTIVLRFKQAGGNTNRLFLSMKRKNI